MDSKFLFKIFQPEIEKMLRNYIFEVEAAKETDEFMLNKEYDFVEIYSFDQDPITNDYIFEYMIFSKPSNEPKFFDEPQKIRVKPMFLIAANYKALKHR